MPSPLFTVSNIKSTSHITALKSVTGMWIKMLLNLSKHCRFYSLMFCRLVKLSKLPHFHTGLLLDLLNYHWHTALASCEKGKKLAMNPPDTKATFSFSMGRTSEAFKPSFRKDPVKGERKKESSNVCLKEILLVNTASDTLNQT